MATKKKSNGGKEPIDPRSQEFKDEVRKQFRTLQATAEQLELQLKAMKKQLDNGTFGMFDGSC